MKPTRFFVVCFLFISSLYSCNLSTEYAKTGEIHSRSIEKSIEKKCFIGFFRVLPTSDSCKLKPDIINCWVEEGWRFENDLFRIKQTRLGFDNFFIKIKDHNFKVQYKTGKWDSWQRASVVIEPDLGYYLQLEDHKPGDTVLIKISNLKDSCEFVLRLQQK